jgi:predicted kinase
MTSDKPPGPERPDQPESDKPDRPGSDKPARPAEPGRSPDLGDRARNLPAGHPSADTRSPREAELPGETEPKGETPTSADDIRPLTDAEYAEHVADVRDSLFKAKADGLATDQQHTIDLDRKIWSDERDLIHDSIIEDMYSRASDVPCEHKAVIAGGLAGAGKTTVLASHAGIDRSQYLTINPDDIKEELAQRGLIPEVEGVSPMEASDLAHEESSYLARQLALRAESDGKNLIWDITMSEKPKTEGRIEELRAAGYTETQGIFVDIPIDVSLGRAEDRHRADHESYRQGDGLGGRLVPPEVIEGQANPEWGSNNRRTFELVKDHFDRWSRYDNSIDGAPARLVDAGTSDLSEANPEERRR